MMCDKTNTEVEPVQEGTNLLRCPACQELLAEDTLAAVVVPSEVQGEPYATNPTRVRVFQEDDHWSIDAVDDTDNYTEEVWDVYNGARMTREQAIAVAPEFAAQHGWSDLPVFVRVGP